MVNFKEYFIKPKLTIREEMNNFYKDWDKLKKDKGDYGEDKFKDSSGELYNKIEGVCQKLRARIVELVHDDSVKGKELEENERVLKNESDEENLDILENLKMEISNYKEVKEKEPAEVEKSIAA